LILMVSYCALPGRRIMPFLSQLLTSWQPMAAHNPPTGTFIRKHAELCALGPTMTFPGQLKLLRRREKKKTVG